MANRQPSPTAAIWRRRLRAVVRLLAGLMIVLLVILLIWSIMANRHLERAIQATRAAGGVLKVAKLGQREIPDDQNAWPLYRDLLTRAGEQGVGMAGQLKHRASTAPLSADEKQRMDRDIDDLRLLVRWSCEPESRPDHDAEMAQRLADHQALLASLGKASERPELVWPVASADGGPAAPLGVYPMPISRLLDFVMVRIVRRGQAGRTDDAVADLAMVFRVANHLTNLPLLGPQHVRATNAGALALQEILPTASISPGQCAMLQKLLAGGMTSAKLRRVVEVNRAVGHQQYVKLCDYEVSPEFLSDRPEPIWPVGHITTWLRRPEFTSNHANELEMYIEVVDVLDGSLRQVVRSLTELAKQRDEAAKQFTGWTHTWALNGVVQTLYAAQYAMASQATRGMTSLALALHAYRQAKGSWPKTLDELAPEFIEAVPLDPTTGKSFGYVREGASPRLYAAGVDMKDNDGAYNSSTPWGDDDTDICFFLEGIPPDARPGTAGAFARGASAGVQ